MFFGAWFSVLGRPNAKGKSLPSHKARFRFFACVTIEPTVL